jgi:O-acetyl-ADP-ribose deacetylase (regulator of RNase III)
MITFRVDGDLLREPVEALVNTVNTVGTMGAGIAFKFRYAYPKNYRAYVLACNRNEVRIGRMFVTKTNDLHGPQWVINFPTKEHWRHPSQLKWIVDGLRDLRRVIEEENIRSLAIPALGCGNGGLSWGDVRPEIEQALGSMESVQVIVFEPRR